MSTTPTSSQALTEHGWRAAAEILRSRGVSFEVLEHPHTETAAAESRATHVPDDRMAKTVIVRGGPTWILAIVGAGEHVDLERLRAFVGSEAPLRLAGEHEIGEHFP